jgi:hypothetical protein
MKWNSAIGGNREALLRILASLFAMIGTSGGVLRPATLPRHLHRLVLRLLRPAESATRRLIILAARAIIVDVSRQSTLKPQQQLPHANPRIRVCVIPRPLSLPLLDPLIRARPRTLVRPSVSPPATVFGLTIPFFQRRAPESKSLTPDDPLDAGRLVRRLEAVGRALDDLHGMARRLALWQARQNAGLEDAHRDGIEKLPASFPAAPDQTREQAAAEAPEATLKSSEARHHATTTPSHRAEFEDSDAQLAPARTSATASDRFAQRGTGVRGFRTRAQSGFRLGPLHAIRPLKAPATYGGFAARQRSRLDTS